VPPRIAKCRQFADAIAVSEQMKSKPKVVIVGGGPAGLMAAQTIAETSNFDVHVYDAMPSVGRKFLLAGRGGLNITHSESNEKFNARYRSTIGDPARILESLGLLDPQAVVQWVHSLGIKTFVGSSGRVFPEQMKAAPLLRAWLLKLKAMGVVFHSRHRLLRIENAPNVTTLTFLQVLDQTNIQVEANACVLALGGASWAKLGSDGTWTELLKNANIAISPLQPSNCGFESKLSSFLVPKFIGAPIKNCSLRMPNGAPHKGEFVLSETGFEGQLIYALSADIREQIAQTGSATISLDLKPDKTEVELVDRLNAPKGSRSLTKHLQTTLNIADIYLALLYEFTPKASLGNNSDIAKAIKQINIMLTKPRPIDEAISTAGGVALKEIDERFMLTAIPNVFVAGEMLDWEAPTGGYLLSACFSTGKAAGSGVISRFASLDKFG
jgi:uncharacterized flavoprotein (TIGR03862 family)